MGIRESIAKVLMPKSKDYKLGAPGTGGGLQFFEMQSPPGWGYQSYLKAYGEIGWLFACVNIIAESVARTPWHLFELDKQGEQTEIFQHELIDLLNRFNPFQTRYQFMYLATMYKMLVGEEFWVMNFEGKRPIEIWLAPPAYMSVVPHPIKYISHYEFKRGNMEKAIPFTIEEIIHIKTPNPHNEYRGLSPAQALTVDLDSERYAARYQQKFFFNDATPGFVLEYPAENMPPAEIRKELVQEWEERYKGFRNRGKTAFLFGAKANVITMSNKDMDFAELRKFNRDAILGAYHIPRSVIGITEDVNRANAEAGNYTFALYTVQPELCAIREALNKELCPLFGDNLYLDFENPVPEDRVMMVNNAVNLFKAKIITRNDALGMVDMEPLEDGGLGDEYFTDPQPSGFGLPALPKLPIEPPEKKVKAVLTTETDRETYWKDYVSRAESYEARVIYEIQMMALKQKEEALFNLNKSTDRNIKLIDVQSSIKEYKRTITPLLTQVMSAAVDNGRKLLEPPNPHKQEEIPRILSPWALRWLRSRIGWAAEQISEETAARLAKILAEGYEQGQSIIQISDRIKLEFDFFSDIRATRIARTEIMMASSQGTIEGYRESGVVEKAEWYLANDERQCVDCEDMADTYTAVPLDDTEGLIPLHPCCRCVWLPIIE